MITFRFRLSIEYRPFQTELPKRLIHWRDAYCILVFGSASAGSFQAKTRSSRGPRWRNFVAAGLIVWIHKPTQFPTSVSLFKTPKNYFFFIICILSMAHLPCIIIMPLPHFFIIDILSIFFIIAASAPPAKAERTRSAARVVLIIIYSFLRLLDLTSRKLARFKQEVWSTLTRCQSQIDDRCVFSFYV